MDSLAESSAGDSKVTLGPALSNSLPETCGIGIKEEMAAGAAAQLRPVFSACTQSPQGAPKMDTILLLLPSRISENICTQTQPSIQVEQMNQNGESE